MRRFFNIFSRLLLLALVVSIPRLPALAADMPVHNLSVKNKAFAPAEITIPAGQKVKLVIKNEEPETIEFESHQLNREKIIPAGKEAFVFIGPLDAGTYSFFNEFHPATTGTIVVK